MNIRCSYSRTAGDSYETSMRIYPILQRYYGAKPVRPGRHDRPCSLSRLVLAVLRSELH